MLKLFKHNRNVNIISSIFSSTKVGKIDDDFCMPEFHSNFEIQLVGIHNVSSAVVLKLPSSAPIVTSLAVASTPRATNNYTVLHLGTDTGSILKVC